MSGLQNPIQLLSDYPVAIFIYVSVYAIPRLTDQCRIQHIYDIWIYIYISKRVGWQCTRVPRLIAGGRSGPRPSTLVRSVRGIWLHYRSGRCLCLFSPPNRRFPSPCAEGGSPRWALLYEHKVRKADQFIQIYWAAWFVVGDLNPTRVWHSTDLATAPVWQ